MPIRVKHGLQGAVLALACAVTAGAASAATIDFGNSSGNFSSYAEDGFVFEPARLVRGNCLAGACLALNRNQETTLTFGDGSTSFSLHSFSFNLLGVPAELTILGSNGATQTFSTDEFGHNTYNLADLGFAFSDVTSILFQNTGRGNIRIDNLGVIGGVQPAAIPVPAAGLLLIGGLGGLAAFARRRATAG